MDHRLLCLDRNPLELRIRRGRDDRVHVLDGAHGLRPRFQRRAVEGLLNQTKVPLLGQRSRPQAQVEVVAVLHGDDEGHGVHGHDEGKVPTGTQPSSQLTMGLDVRCCRCCCHSPRSEHDRDCVAPAPYSQQSPRREL